MHSWCSVEGDDTTESPGAGRSLKKQRRMDVHASRCPCPTFLLFSSLPLIANLHRAYAEDDRDDEEQNTTDDTRGDRLVLHPSRHWEFHLLAGAVVGRRVGEHLEIIGPTTDQILHCARQGAMKQRIVKTNLLVVRYPPDGTYRWVSLKLIDQFQSIQGSR